MRMDTHEGWASSQCHGVCPARKMLWQPSRGGETRHRKHRRTSSIIQITCKVLVSGAIGMGALLATLEAMVATVPSSDQGALPRGLLHALYTHAQP